VRRLFQCTPMMRAAAVLATLASVNITASTAKSINWQTSIQQIQYSNQQERQNNGNKSLRINEPEDQLKYPAEQAVNSTITNSSGERKAALRAKALDANLKCTPMIRGGEAYAGLIEGKQAWEIAKKEQGLLPKVEALQCIANALGVGVYGWEDKIDILALIKEVEPFLANAQRAKDLAMIYAFEYLKGQLLRAEYAKDRDQVIRSEALRSTRNAVQAAELAGDKGYKLVAQMATTSFYQPGIEDRDNIEIRESVETALANWKTLPRPHQAKPFYYSAKIDEQEKKYDKALLKLEKALDLSVIDSERVIILNDILRIKALTLKYSDTQARKAGIKLRSINRNILWNQMIALEFEDREQLLKDPRWQIALQPGARSPSMDHLLWYELNMRGLALEAEKSINNRNPSQGPSTPSPELSIKDIQNSLDEGELLLVLGEMQATFDEQTFPYTRKTVNNTEQNHTRQMLKETSVNYFIAQVSQSRYSFKWNGLKQYADQVAADFIKNLEENTTDSAELFKNVSRKLYSNMELDSSYHTIYIVPYGAYSNIPLGAMLESNMDTRMPRERKIRILSNARELVIIKSNKESSGLHRLAIFGDPDLSDISRYSNERRGDLQEWFKLPYSMTEAIGIKNQTLNSSLFTGKDFTIEEFDNSLKQNTLLHLATHAFYGANTYDNSDVNRERAGIVFSGANRHANRYINDSILTPNAIAKMPFKKVSLISVSGCNSGRSKSVNLETWSGLQRAFFAAGAKSTLSALWKVDDKATAEFMIRFYKYLKTGIDRSEALAATRRDFQKGIPSHTEEWKAPYYWAAWQLVGDWRPIKGL